MCHWGFFGNVQQNAIMVAFCRVSFFQPSRSDLKFCKLAVWSNGSPISYLFESSDVFDTAQYFQLSKKLSPFVVFQILLNIKVFLGPKGPPLGF